jgi:hypothetical protein
MDSLNEFWYKLDKNATFVFGFIWGATIITIIAKIFQYMKLI